MVRPSLICSVKSNTRDIQTVFTLMENPSSHKSTSPGWNQSGCWTRGKPPPLVSVPVLRSCPSSCHSSVLVIGAPRAKTKTEWLASNNRGGIGPFLPTSGCATSTRCRDAEIGSRCVLLSGRTSSSACMGGSCQMAARCHDGSNQRQPLLPTTRGWERNHGMVVTSPTIRPTRDGRRAGQGWSLQWPPPKSPQFPHPCLARPAWQRACCLIQPAGRDQGSGEIPPPDFYISED